MDLVCLSHLRWDFVYQRPQHLMRRFAAAGERVFYLEETVPGAAGARLELLERQGVQVVKPHVPAGVAGDELQALHRRLIDALVESRRISDYALWYYSPLQLPVSEQLLAGARAVVYDCMDELSAFEGAPPELAPLEDRLFEVADVVFTGGQSLYEAKRDRHRSVHLFPSSVDEAHFARARSRLPEPADQAPLPRPRIGFFGVVDERLDCALLDAIAAGRPDWQFVLVGEVVKIDPAHLPRRPNLHYLGLRPYAELPAYLAGWDVAILPFAHNRSTRFVSPTKIPEYLAGGRPVVATSIPDVVRAYARPNLVRIADTPEDFMRSLELAMQPDREWLERVDRFLAQTSWDRTWQAMDNLLEIAIARRAASGGDSITAAAGLS